MTAVAESTQDTVPKQPITRIIKVPSTTSVSINIHRHKSVYSVIRKRSEAVLYHKPIVQ
jgi:hypothetical protein